RRPARRAEPAPLPRSRGSHRSDARAASPEGDAAAPERALPLAGGRSCFPEVYPNGRMVRRGLALSLLAVHSGRKAPLGQRAGREDVVDTEAVVLRETEHAVVPPRK